MNNIMNPNPFQGYAPEPMRAQGFVIGRSQDTTEERRAFCLSELVPIWERWTDGNQTLRRVLECPNLSAPDHDARFRTLLAVANALSRHGGKTWSVKAAQATVLAYLSAHMSVPEDEWIYARSRAVAYDVVAREELRRMQEVLDISLPPGPS